MDGKKFGRLLLSWLEQCLLSRAPQADPASVTTLSWALLAYATIDLLQARTGSDWQTSLGMTALDMLIMVLFSWAVLRLAKKSVRYLQTLTALAGTGAVLGLVGLPLIQQAAQAHPDEGPAGTLVLGWLVLLVWSILIQAHIYRHALSTRYGAGLLVAGLQMVLVISLLGMLYPRATGS